MRTFLQISILLFFASCSQKKIKVVVETYRNGNQKTVRYFSSTKDAETKFQTTVSNGIITTDDPIDFIEEGYYENGQLNYKGTIKKGLTNGLWEYYYKSGLPQARSYYLNNKSTDTVLCWYPSGKLKRHSLEIDTLKNYWHSTDYYENGQKMIECYQKKDSIGKVLLEGSFNEWFSNGKIKIEISLKNNYSVGKWKEWDSTGKIIMESDSKRKISFE